MKLTAVPHWVVSLLVVVTLSPGCRTSESSLVAPHMKSRQELRKQIFENRKMIYSATVTLVSETPDSVRRELPELAKQYGGYVSFSDGDRMTLRVTSDNLEAALARLESFGKITQLDRFGQDVTDSYFDAQTRLDNAEQARQRYLQLLERAGTVEDLLLIERELERLNATIETLKAKMARLDDQEALAKIDVFVRERKKPGPLGYLSLGVYHAVKWLFVRN